MSDTDNLKKLISSYERRLQKLKEEQAAFGIQTPPHILTEIEDIEEKLGELRTELSVSSSPMFYGIIKDPDLRAYINRLSIEVKDKINDVIDSLQSNPRPPGHKPTAIAPEFVSYVITATKPKYTLTYKIDDTRQIVAVLRLDEKNFS